jgi:uncharacterized protein YbjT (DUF2867 family)
VYLSQLAADQQSPVRFPRYHGAVEAALTNSTVGWTVVRPNPILQAYLPFAPARLYREDGNPDRWESP